LLAATRFPAGGQPPGWFVLHVEPDGRSEPFLAPRPHRAPQIPPRNGQF